LGTVIEGRESQETNEPILNSDFRSRVRFYHVRMFDESQLDIAPSGPLGINF